MQYRDEYGCAETTWELQPFSDDDLAPPGELLAMAQASRPSKGKGKRVGVAHHENQRDSSQRHGKDDAKITQAQGPHYELGNAQ